MKALGRCCVGVGVAVVVLAVAMGVFIQILDSYPDFRHKYFAGFCYQLGVVHAVPAFEEIRCDLLKDVEGPLVVEIGPGPGNHTQYTQHTTHTTHTTQPQHHTKHFIFTENIFFKGTNFLCLKDNKKVKKWIGIEPNLYMQQYLFDLAKKHNIAFEIDLKGIPGERLPLESDSADTVIGYVCSLFVTLVIVIFFFFSHLFLFFYLFSFFYLCSFSIIFLFFYLLFFLLSF